MPDLQNLLDQIDRLDQEATKGPWNHQEDNVMGDPYVENGYTKIPYIAQVVRNENDAPFIALSRTALPQLAKAVRAVMEDCQSVENLIHKDHTYRTGYDYGMRSQARAVMEAITDALKGQDND